MRICPNCNEEFTPWRGDQIFCSVGCNREFKINERRQALAAWRQQKAEEEQRSASA